MKILHTSDNHGINIDLPRGHFDFFFDTGDFSTHDTNNLAYDEHYQRHLNRKAEAEFQLGYFKDIRIPFYKNIDAKVKIVVKGNHDFLILPQNKIIDTPTENVITREGMKIGILRGSNIIATGGIVGGWDEEIDEYQFKQRLLSIDPDIDILLSHQPPANIFDLCGDGRTRIGSREIYNAIFGNLGIPPYFTKLKAHCFGHVHENFGLEEMEIEGRKIIFSNASSGYRKPKAGEGFNILEI